MRTTLDLPDGTFRELKAKAALEGTTVKELLNRYVVRGLTEDASPAAAPRPKRSKFPISLDVGGPNMRYVSGAEAQELFDAEDLERLHENFSR
jgi:hypothetical protein